LPGNTGRWFVVLAVLRPTLATGDRAAAHHGSGWRDRRQPAAGPVHHQSPRPRRTRHPSPTSTAWAWRGWPSWNTGLTQREIQVLRLIAEGLSDEEIADLLIIAESTAKTHVKRILAKIGTRDRAQAVVLAYRAGLMALGHREVVLTLDLGTDTWSLRCGYSVTGRSVVLIDGSSCSAPKSDHGSIWWCTWRWPSRRWSGGHGSGTCRRGGRDVMRKYRDKYLPA